jgi:putative endonuclease
MDVGLLAEDFVAQWLIQQGWSILFRRWRCRWGELDLIAQWHMASSIEPISPSIAFVEVKARGDRNWDEGGLLAVTPKKQAKLHQTAQLFLAQHPQWSDCSCQFDVALVNYRRRPILQTGMAATPPALAGKAIEINRPFALGDYTLCLKHYMTAAFQGG